MLRGTLFFVNPSGPASKVAGAVVVKKELQTEAFYKKVLYKGDYKGALYLRGSSEAPHSKVYPTTLCLTLLCIRISHST